MHLRSRFFSVAVLAGVVACGGDSTGVGPSAASVTGIAGDNQTTTTGQTLSFPLSFVARNSSGDPAPGVHVSWSVSPAGAAAFQPPDSTTDANGATSTIVTATSYIGAITISAKVTGVPSVVYHATVTDPCLYLAPLTLGQTVNGALLASTDCLGSSWYYDFYSVTLPAGQPSMRISMHADTNDTYLLLWSGVQPEPLVAFDDDSILDHAGARNSQLDVILPAGEYIVGATSFAPFDQFAYSLLSAGRPAAMNGCRPVWVVRGVSVTDDIATTDCQDSSATPHYYDVARMFLIAGSVVAMSERSAAINPSLALYRIDIGTLVSDSVNGDSTYARQLVTSNDDSSATNPDAFIQFTVDTTGFYDVFISTSARGETGAYTFSVDTTTTLSAPRSAPVTSARQWWGTGPGELLLRLRGRRHSKR